MPLADTFFDSSTWTLARNLTGFFVVVFWLATAFWVYKDARRRIEDPWLVAHGGRCSGSFPPFLGPIIYLFFRPPESIEDARERELEIRAIEERLAAARSPLPRLPRPGRAVVPRLPRLHDAAQAGVRLLRASARADLAGVPVLRDAGAPGRGRRRGVAAAPARRAATS